MSKLCNACWWFNRNFPGYCLRPNHDGAPFPRVTHEREWPTDQPNHCGPEARFFLPKELQRERIKAHA